MQPAQDGAHALRLSPSPDADEPLTTSFFSKPPVDPFEAWDDTHLPVMPHGSRRAMFATLAIFAVSVLALGAYVAYARFVMPVPAELGSRGLPSSVAIATVPAPPPAAGAAASAVMPPIAAPAPAAVAAVVPPAPAQPTLTVDPPPSTAAPPSVAAAPPLMGDPPPSTAAIPSPAAARAAAPAASDPGVSEMLAGANAPYQGRKRREALAAYQAVLARDPNASEALSKIAYIYLDKSDNARARRFAARAVELDPNSSEGWIVLGAALEGLGDRPGARNAYRTCASLGSDTYAAECRKLAR